MKTPWISASLTALLATSLMAGTEFTIDQAEEEAKRLRPERLHYGEPFTHYETIGAGAKLLRERLIELSTAGELPGGQQLPWRRVITNSVILSSISEWNQLEIAKEGIEKWFEIIDARTEIAQSKRIQLALNIADVHAANWIRAEPVYTAGFLQSVEERYLPDASQDSVQAWYFGKAGFSYHLLHAATMLEDKDQAALLQELAMQSHKSYWLNPDVELPHRTFSLVAHARMLFTRGESLEAEALLDDWWEQHGDKINSGEFYSAWFFTAWNGRGDVDKARKIVGLASDIVARDGSVRNPGDFETMVRAYYARIFLSEIDLSIEAEQSQAEKLAANAGKEL